jgi:SAM-dependent methyltransferase
MPKTRDDHEYILDSEEEPLRLERQARLYGSDDDLRHLALRPGDRVLDAGCGPGSVTRTIARAVPEGQATGVDREPKYVEFARRRAAEEAIENIQFEVGDLLQLPFSDESFDVIWSKHVLQFVSDRERAIAEFKRVCRSGGRVMCCNYDHFCVCHYPTDPELQADIELYFDTWRREAGGDNLLGRKLPHLFMQAGLGEIKVDFIPDRVLGGFGGDSEKRWNWQTQLRSAIGFGAKVFGSLERAEHFNRRFVERFSRPDVYVYCPLFYVEGRVP